MENTKPEEQKTELKVFVDIEKEVAIKLSKIMEINNNHFGADLNAMTWEDVRYLCSLDGTLQNIINYEDNVDELTVEEISAKTRQKIIEITARKHFHLDTLKKCGNDDLDYFEASVVSVERALIEAYEAGKAAKI